MEAFLPILLVVAVAACCGLPLLLLIAGSALKGGEKDSHETAGSEADRWRRRS